MVFFPAPLPTLPSAPAVETMLATIADAAGTAFAVVTAETLQNAQMVVCVDTQQTSYAVVVQDAQGQ